MKKIFSNKYVLYSLFAIGGLFIGWLFFHSPDKKDYKHDQSSEVAKKTIWTCAMHPHIRMDKPGYCPICGMELIPLNHSSVSIDPGAIHLTKEAAELANVLTSVVTKQKPIKEVRLYGKVQADERLLQSQVAHIPGRIEKLSVNFTGEVVRNGQTLAVIYSPELVTAQQELLETVKTKDLQPEIYEAAKERLKQWKLTELQIAAIESSGVVQNNFELKSTISGIVTARRVSNGDYVTQGSILFEIANLSNVWVMFDAYESDLPFLNKGNKISFTVQALPGTNFSGNITFIDPVIDPVTRVSKVRVEINNHAGKLKPEMFATGIVSANLAEYKNNFIIPRSAVLWTGKRSIVYVKQTETEEPIFKIREVELGPMLGNSYVIISGLSEGEEIVTQGTFSVDAAAQLEGKPSMMNPTGGKTNTMPGMDMPGDDKSQSSKDKPSGQSTSTMPGMDMSNDVEKQGGSTLHSKHQQQNSNEHSIHDAKTMTQHTMFAVSGNCELCKERVEKAAKAVNGVTSAVWDLNTHNTQVEFNSMETSNDAIQKAIAHAGHDTEKFKADDKTYNKLPDCCKYRK